MHEHDLSAPNRPPERPANNHDGRIRTDQVDTTWGSNTAPAVLAGGGRMHVFATVDCCNCKCTGVPTGLGAKGRGAFEPLRQGGGRHFGAGEAHVAGALKLSDGQGSNYMAEDRRTEAPEELSQCEIAFLGIEASSPFFRQANGKGVAERSFGTLQEHLLWGWTLHTVEAHQAAVRALRICCNAKLLIQRHGQRVSRSGARRSAGRRHGRRRPALGSLMALCGVERRCRTTGE